MTVFADEHGPRPRGLALDGDFVFATGAFTPRFQSAAPLTDADVTDLVEHEASLLDPAFAARSPGCAALELARWATPA